MPIIMILRILVGPCLKQLILTIGLCLVFIIFSFYVFSWWGLLMSIIGIPLILFISIAYLVNQIKKNPMKMFQSMVMSSPAMSAMLNKENLGSVCTVTNTKDTKDTKDNRENNNI